MPALQFHIIFLLANFSFTFSLDESISRNNIVPQIPQNWKSLLTKDVYDYYYRKRRIVPNELFEGDIARSRIVLINAIPNKEERWTDAIVPYRIDDTFTSQEKHLIHTAFDDLMSKTCIQFVPHSQQVDYVRLVRGVGCSSHVGRLGGEQQIGLQPGCITQIGEVQHEMLHALGFYHEQNRLDRDEYVQIIWSNIINSTKSQFEKYQTDAMGMPYDYESVMHYGWNYFAKDASMPTILPKTKPGVRRPEPKGLGSRAVVSATDVQKINRLYECPRKDTTIGAFTTSQPSKQSTPTFTLNPTSTTAQTTSVTIPASTKKMTTSTTTQPTSTTPETTSSATIKTTSRTIQIINSSTHKTNPTSTVKTSTLIAVSTTPKINLETTIKTNSMTTDSATTIARRATIGTTFGSSSSETQTPHQDSAKDHESNSNESDEGNLNAFGARDPLGGIDNGAAYLSYSATPNPFELQQSDGEVTTAEPAKKRLTSRMPHITSKRVQMFTRTNSNMASKLSYTRSSTDPPYRDIGEDRPRYAKDPAYENLPWPAISYFGSKKPQSRTTTAATYFRYTATANPFLVDLDATEKKR